MSLYEVTRLINWGIISSANIGVKAVAPAILASTNGRLVAVGSRDVRHAAEAYSFAPSVRIYDSYDGIINDPAIEAVYIPLPNSLHAEWSIKALEAGKHVLCERPLASTLQEAEEMVEVARAHNVLLMEACAYRFHPQIIWALEQIHAGLLGPVRLVRGSCSVDMRAYPDTIRLNPELGGGSLMDVGYGPVNFCRAVYSQPARSLAARVHATSAVSVEMATNAVLDFGDGQFGLIDSSFELPLRQYVEVVGEAGSMTIPVPFTPGNHDVVVFVTKNGRMTEQNFTHVDQYQLEVEHFAACIRTQQEPALSLSETLENMAMLEAIYQAAGLDWPIV